MRGIGEIFGVQVGQVLGAAEHRNGTYPTYVERGAQAATTQMGRMGAEDPSILPSAPYKAEDLGQHLARAAVDYDLRERVERCRLSVDDDQMGA